MEARIRNSIDLLRRVVNPSMQVSHRCDHDVCHPINIAQAIAIASQNQCYPDWTHFDPDVWLCRLGGLHYCTQRSCKYYLDPNNRGICHVSGAKYTQPVTAYSRNPTHSFRRASRGLSKGKPRPKRRQQSKPQEDPMGMTRRKRPAHQEEEEDEEEAKRLRRIERHKKRTRHEGVSKDLESARAYMEQAKQIVCDLLWSKKRDRIVEHAIEKRETLTRRAIQAYREERSAAQEFVNEFDLLCIKTNVALSQIILAKVQRDDARLRYYQSAIWTAWGFCQRCPYAAETGRAVAFGDHAIAFVYLMREGLSLEGVELVPRDDYLALLPMRSDLKLIDAPGRKNITDTLRHITKCYRSAVNAGWSPAEINIIRPFSHFNAIKERRHHH